ncbi:unnamed protein product [Mesocestoides corti]|uniref:Zf-3CxxC domain-containing protein n=1 Tax=Mesocestoides corti TaxID=53468 RepID=A0A0R3U6H2_MESCO|nr:unnamed protein product [Mesocestoides corti]
MVVASTMKPRCDSPIPPMSSICTCESCINDYLYVYERKNVAGLLSLPVLSTEVSKEVGEDFYFWLQQKYGPCFCLNYRAILSIHIVWIGTFYRLFVYPTNLRWRLRPYDSPSEVPYSNCVWGATESAKVRFTCTDCGKIWTSISALASFALCLEYEDGQQNWSLWYCLHGQTCSNCALLKAEPKLHYGTWYPHEVFRVLKSVHSKIDREILRLQRFSTRVTATGTSNYRQESTIVSVTQILKSPKVQLTLVEMAVDFMRHFEQF